MAACGLWPRNSPRNIGGGGGGGGGDDHDDDDGTEDWAGRERTEHVSGAKSPDDKT